MKHIFVVTVRPDYSMPKISQEAYDSLEKDQAFIEHRADAPRKLTDFQYESNRYEYLIHDLILR